jgi:uncharacterized membrane protein
MTEPGPATETLGAEGGSAEESSAEEGSAERLVFFTDAVAAIAITLLILPLLDTIGEVSRDRETLGELVHHNLGQFAAFALSFGVIFRLWWAHHRLFRHIETIGPWIVRASILWTFSIALMPIPTAIITKYHPSAGSVGIYGGTLVLATGALTVMTWYAYRNPRLSGDRPPVRREDVLLTFLSFLVQILATVLGCLVIRINFWAFLLLFLAGPLETLVETRLPRRRNLPLQ